MLRVITNYCTDDYRQEKQINTYAKVTKSPRHKVTNKERKAYSLLLSA